MTIWSEEKWKKEQEKFPALVAEAQDFWQKFNIDGKIGDAQITLWLVDYFKTCEEGFITNCPPNQVFLDFAANKETLMEVEFLKMAVKVMKRR